MNDSSSTEGEVVPRKDWEALHFDDRSTIVADMHSHPALKRQLPVPHLALSRLRSATTFFPIALRTSFDRVYKGGVDVLVSGVVPPEREFFKDIAFFSELGPVLKLLGWLIFMKGESHFDFTYRQLAMIEDKVEVRYNQHKRRKRKGLPEAGVAHSYAELAQLLDAGKIGVVHSVEGGHCLEGPLASQYKAQPSSVGEVEAEVIGNLEKLAADHALVYITLGHYYPNVITTTGFPYPQRIVHIVTRRRWDSIWRDLTTGLTPLGEKVIQRMLELGVLIDVNHVTPTTRRRVYQIVEDSGKQAAVIASHVGVQSINPDPYNLEDWEIKWIADHGGVIGVMFSNYWLLGHDGSDLGISHISNTIKHFINAAGEEGVNAVGLGTDFDGFSDPPDDLVDASEMPRLTQRLMIEKYLSEDSGIRYRQIQGILGGNFMRVLKDGWQVPL